MIVKAIKTIEWHDHHTKIVISEGSFYEVIIISKPFVDKEIWLFKVKCDDGCIRYIHSYNFITLEEFRETQLNNLLDLK
jgi:hypothetical protein